MNDVTVNTYINGSEVSCLMARIEELHTKLDTIMDTTESLRTEIAELRSETAAAFERAAAKIAEIQQGIEDGVSADELASLVAELDADTEAARAAFASTPEEPTPDGE